MSLSFKVGGPCEPVDGNFWWPGSDLSDQPILNAISEKNISNQLFVLKTVIVSFIYSLNCEIHKLIQDLVMVPQNKLTEF